MIRSISIENFRLFRSFKLGTEGEELRPVTLVGGDNNTGKTALLEAIRVALSEGEASPALVESARGVSAWGTRHAWTWLFYRGQASSPARLRAEGSKPRLVELSVSERTSTVDGEAATSESSPLLLNLVSLGNVVEIVPYRSGWRTAGSRPAREPACVFVSAQPGDVVGRFSLVSDVPAAKDRLVDQLKRLEPRLEDLDIGLWGNIPYIRADVGLSEKIPMDYLGMGVRRALSFLLALHAVPEGGVLLIDEFENGLYHQHLEAVFRSLCEAAAERDVQVVATSHSREFIRATVAALDNDPDRLAYVRLDREGDDITPVFYDHHMLKTADDLWVEVR